MKRKNYKAYLGNMLPCIGYGLLTGIFTGATIFFFKYLAGKAEKLSRFLYGEAKGSVLKQQYDIIVGIVSKKGEEIIKKDGLMQTVTITVPQT